MSDKTKASILDAIDGLERAGVVAASQADEVRECLGDAKKIAKLRKMLASVEASDRDSVAKPEGDE